MRLVGAGLLEMVLFGPVVLLVLTGHLGLGIGWWVFTLVLYVAWATQAMPDALVLCDEEES